MVSFHICRQRFISKIIYKESQEMKSYTLPWGLIVERHGASKPRLFDCWFNSLLTLIKKENVKARIAGPLRRNPLVCGEFHINEW